MDRVVLEVAAWGLAGLMLMTKRDRTGSARSNPRLRIQKIKFDGGRHVSTEEILDQPAVSREERHSGHTRDIQPEPSGPPQREAGPQDRSQTLRETRFEGRSSALLEGCP